MAQNTLEASWQHELAAEFSLPYMQKLRAFLQQEQHAGKVIYPKNQNIFQAFRYTPFAAVKVVILGQDPYHQPGQAHGLSFSVPPRTKIPPSLVNIYKELQRDLAIVPPQHGCLAAWAEQGVLLLNSILTVEQGQAAAHHGKGWEQFTDAVIAALNARGTPVIFLLWGQYAQKKGGSIDRQKHLVLQAPHPSPLSAHQGFLGCGHFSAVNRQLQAWGQAPIVWQLGEAEGMRHDVLA
jgi:uracil-DNA glycosylase